MKPVSLAQCQDLPVVVLPDMSEHHLFWDFIEELFIVCRFGMFGFNKLDVCNDRRESLFCDKIWFQKKCLKMRLAIIYQEHGLFVIHCYSV